MTSARGGSELGSQHPSGFRYAQLQKNAMLSFLGGVSERTKTNLSLSRNISLLYTYIKVEFTNARNKAPARNREAT